ncbi:MAG: D-aminoacyl-tRNA deacylase [candidate division Zixibacteria bacterium]|nr:D-aminoacyl-tRNA deacylase [candidate division Zixibacteria bacterium]
MRLVLQRVIGCQVWIGGELYSSIAQGLLILFGTKTGDNELSCTSLADKAINLRIFEDSEQKMNLSVLDLQAQIMIVSQFTLYADTRKGRRPAFTDAMEPVAAAKLYNIFVEKMKTSGLDTQTGQFGRKMDLTFTNHGPVTIILDHDV